jgi:ABC-2 type transport system permease protein
VALPLIVLTNIVLNVSPFIFLLSTGTMVFATFALTALALGFGAVFPNYETDNVAEIPTSFGGLLYMMVAVSYLAGVILLEAWPVYSHLSSDFPDGAVRNSLTLPLVLGMAGAATLTITAVVLPLRVGMRRVMHLDF